MNFINIYSNPDQWTSSTNQRSLTQQQQKKLILAIQNKFSSLSLSIINSLLNPQNSSINQSSKLWKNKQCGHKLKFCLINDSKIPQYNYMFEVQIDFQISKIKIVSTILKDGLILHIFKQGLIQLICSYFLIANSRENIYSLRIDPFTGVIKYIYTSQCSQTEINNIKIYPVDFCKVIADRIQQMVNLLNNNYLTKILNLSNELSSKNVENAYANKQEQYDYKNHKDFMHQQKVSSLQQSGKLLKTLRRYISNSTIKYSFFSKDPENGKIRFLPELGGKRKQPQKQQKMVRHNMKIMPFTKDIKRILSLYTPIGELIQEECLYGKMGDISWIQPNYQQIKAIQDILRVDWFQIGGKILTTILIHSIQGQVQIGVGGFAEIRRIIVNVCRRNQSDISQVKNSSLLPKTTKQIFVRKVAAKQKLFWQKQIINHMSKGSCILINKYFEPKLDPQSQGIDKNIFQDSIFTQFCQQKSLNNYLAKMNCILSIKSKIFLIYQVVVGLRFLRDYGIVHLDLKPQNILVKMAFIKQSVLPLVKIIDFGQAYCQNIIHKRTNRGHTCPYASPQLVRHSDKYTQKSDVFSLGVMILIIIFELNTVDIKRLTSSVIYQLNDRYLKFYSICLQKCRYLGYEPYMLSILNLAYRCISPIPTSRPYLNWICCFFKALIDNQQTLQL